MTLYTGGNIYNLEKSQIRQQFYSSGIQDKMWANGQPASEKKMSGMMKKKNRASFQMDFS